MLRLVRLLSILININGELIPREQATVSVFDSGFILGDGIWEGLRVHDGAIPFLDRHLKRLWEGAKALDLDMGLSQETLSARLFQTLKANQMTDHVHIRLMVTRGIKSTPYQDPAVTISGPTIVIIPEFKAPDPTLNDRGLRLYTVYTRRGYADVQDPRINSHSKLPNHDQQRQYAERSSGSWSLRRQSAPKPNGNPEFQLIHRL